MHEIRITLVKGNTKQECRSEIEQNTNKTKILRKLFVLYTDKLCNRLIRISTHRYHTQNFEVEFLKLFIIYHCGLVTHGCLCTLSYIIRRHCILSCSNPIDCIYLQHNIEEETTQHINIKIKRTREKMLTYGISNVT